MNLNADSNELDLEYKDLVKDPTNPEALKIESEIPVQYKDKSPDELITMHVNLEKVLRRQGNELGQLRRLVDQQSQLILNQTNVAPKQTEKKAPEITAENLLNDPKGTVSTVVEQHPRVTSNDQRLNQMERQLAQEQFTRAHPTAVQDINDPNFQEWVTASPTRSKLLMKLHHEYDVGAGNELWDLWKDHKEAKEASENARKGRVAAVSTVKNAGGEPTGKTIYSRAKLGELQLRAQAGDPVALAKWNDPEFQKEYMLAYAEDRVR